MKQTIEFDGKNVDNAVEKACLSLNVAKKNLVYDVISSGSTGIFGIVGVKKAKIRVAVPENKDSDSNDRAGVMSIVDEAFGKEIKKDVIDNHYENNYSTNDISEKNPKSTELKLFETHQIKEDNKTSDDEHALEAKKSVNHLEDENQLNSDKKQNRVGNRQSSYTAKTKKTKGKVRKSYSGRKDSDDNLNDTENEKFKYDKSEQDGTDDGSEELSEDRLNSRKRFKGKGTEETKPLPLSHHKQHYSRKSRSKKKDTWLRAEADAALNEVMAAPSNESETSSDLSLEEKQNNTKNRIMKKTSSSDYDNKTKAESNIDETIIKDGGYELDNEFLNEDFHNGSNSYDKEEDDAPYIKNDDEIADAYDERDDGYPPKYKGEIPVDVSEEAVNIGIETLQRMVSLITDAVTVTAQSDEDRLLLKVEGGNSGVLIGRRGQTLEAMQYLTDKIINHYSESRVRLKVDIEGYTETRKANLTTLAYKMADRVKKTGKPATINQMSAQDRRVIHLTLKDDPRVRTQSMGDGYYRRLVIFPKKSSFKRRKNFRK